MADTENRDTQLSFSAMNDGVSHGGRDDVFIKRIPELVSYQKEKKDFSDGYFTMGYLSALRIIEFKLKQLIE